MDDGILAMITELKEGQARMSEQIKGALKRIDEQKQLTESVHKLATSVEILANSQRQMEKTVDGLSADIEEIKRKPAKRFDDAVGTVIAIVLTAIVTYVLSKIGL